MGARQKDWARRTREKLFDLMGRKCAQCGASQDEKPLEFDVIFPTESGKPDGNGHHRKMDWSHRMSFYRRQHDAGNLQVLCDSCNGRKAARIPDHPPEFNWEHVGELQPF
jgi:5-methylcytosine-specific restriction endonuclease McrA